MNAVRMSAARSLLERARQLWWLKAAGTALFMWLFFRLYFLIQGAPHFPVRQVPLTWLDRAIPMQYWAWWPYLSLWVYTGLPPALQPDLRALIHYGVCIGLLCGLGLACFYLWPTSTATLYKPPEAVLDALKGIDLAGNACPSLHVASAVFSWAWLRTQLREAGAGRRWQLASLIWACAIVVSTLVTKQHAAWDVLGGALLGGTGAAAALRSRRVPFVARFLRGAAPESR
jgi:membrane-associated phospholipid phosphatase